METLHSAFVSLTACMKVEVLKSPLRQSRSHITTLGTTAEWNMSHERHRPLSHKITCALLLLLFCLLSRDKCIKHYFNEIQKRCHAYRFLAKANSQPLSLVRPLLLKLKFMGKFKTVQNIMKFKGKFKTVRNIMTQNVYNNGKNTEQVGTDSTMVCKLQCSQVCFIFSHCFTCVLKILGPVTVFISGGSVFQSLVPITEKDDCPNVVLRFAILQFLLVAPLVLITPSCIFTNWQTISGATLFTHLKIVLENRSLQNCQNLVG